jgi:hypothetical protein
MAIKLTLQRLTTEVSPALKKLAAIKLKGKLRLRITRLLTAVHAEMTIWDKARDEIIAAYEYKNEKGQQSVPEDQLEDYTDQVNEAMKEEVELNVGPLKMSLLKNIEIEPIILVGIGPLLEDDEEPDEEPKPEDKGEGEEDDEDDND